MKLKYLLILLSPGFIGCGGCDDPARKQQAYDLLKEGVSLESQGQYSDAAAHYRQAILLYPKYRDAHFQLGALMERMAAFAEAETLYRQAIAIRSDDAQAYNNLGNVLGSQGRLREAIEAYEASLAITDTIPSAHYNIGHSLMLAHDFTRAEEELATAVRLRPGEIRYQESLAMFYLNQAQPQKAIPILQTCLGLDSLRPTTLKALATAYEALEGYDEAMLAWERYLAVLQDGEDKAITRLRIRELRMRRTDAKKRPLRS